MTVIKKKTVKKLKHANVRDWKISKLVKTVLDVSDVKHLKSAYTFYVNSFFEAYDSYQNTELWLAYNKYRKDEPKWKQAYKKQRLQSAKLHKDIMMYKNHVSKALLKPPNHVDILKTLNEYKKRL